MVKHEYYTNTIIENPFNLFQTLEKIDYGFWDGVNNKKFEKDHTEVGLNKDLTIFDHRIRILLPDELLIHKVGSCAETAIYQYFALRYFDPELFYIDENYNLMLDEPKSFHLHLGTLFRYIDGRYYWFEYSWNGQKGIHGPYDTKDMLLDDVKDKFRMNRDEDKIFIRYGIDIRRFLSYHNLSYYHIVNLAHRYGEYQPCASVALDAIYGGIAVDFWNELTRDFALAIGIPVEYLLKHPDTQQEIDARLKIIDLMFRDSNATEIIKEAQKKMREAILEMRDGLKKELDDE